MSARAPLPQSALVPVSVAHVARLAVVIYDHPPSRQILVAIWEPTARAWGRPRLLDHDALLPATELVTFTALIACLPPDHLEALATAS